MKTLKLRQDGADFWSEDGGRSTAPERVWRGKIGRDSIEACQAWAREFYGALNIAIEIVDRFDDPGPQVGDRIYVASGTYVGTSGTVKRLRRGDGAVFFHPDGHPAQTLCVAACDVRSYGEVK